MFKKCEIESDTNLEMPKMSQELLGFRISNFKPELKICQKFAEFILSDILWQKCRVVSKSYTMLCNICSRIRITLFIWFTIFAKVDGFKILKWKHVVQNAWSWEM